MCNFVWARILVGLVILLLLSGCLDDALETQTANQLKIWEDPLPVGVVGEPYEAVVGARIENSPFDGEYDVTYRIVDSELPPGLTFVNDDSDGERAYIRGIPEVAGTTALVLQAESDRLRIQQEREEEEETGFWAWTNVQAQDEVTLILEILEDPMSP